MPKIINTLKNRFLLGSSFKKDVLWTFVTQIVIMLLAFGITKVASNKLSIDDFGQYNVIRRSVSVISFVMLAGMGITVPRYMAIYQGRGHYRKMIDLMVCSIIFVGIVSLLTIIICVCLSPLLVPVVAGASDNTVYWLTIAFSLGSAISSLLIAYYRGINNFKKYSISQIALQFLLFLCLMFVPCVDVKRILLSWVIVSVLLTVCFFVFENGENNQILFRSFRVRQMPDMMKTIVSYSLPRMLGDFFLFSFSAFPVIYLSQRTSLSDVAYFSVGLTVVNMATPVFSFLGVILLPYVSGALSKGKFNEADHLIRRLTIWYIVLALLMTAFLGVFMTIIIQIFFSPDYLASKDIARIIVLSVVPQSMYLLYRNPVDAVATFPYNTLILVVSFVVLVLFFVLSKSLSDYSYSYAIASTVQGGLSVLAWCNLRKRYVQK